MLVSISFPLDFLLDSPFMGVIPLDPKQQFPFDVLLDSPIFSIDGGPYVVVSMSVSI